MLYSPTGVPLALMEAPDLTPGATLMGWWRPSAVVAGYQIFWEIDSPAWSFLNTVWVGLELNSMNFALEMWNDPHDEYDVASEVAIAGLAYHLAVVVAAGGKAAKLYVSNEALTMDALEVASVANADFDPTDVGVVDGGIQSDTSKGNTKLFHFAMTPAQIRLERDRWQCVETPWAHWPMDRRAYVQAQTRIQDVSGNERHLDNYVVQGFGADTLDPSILRYTYAGATRRVVGAAATAAAAVTTINVAVPAGAYSSGNDVVAVNDAMILSLVHGGADWAVVPAAWTLVQRGLSGVMRLEVYRKNYGMLAGVPTAEVTPVAITGIDGGIGRIVVYHGLEHPDAIEIASSVKTGDNIRPNCDVLETGDDWGPACLDVMVVGFDSNTAIFTDTWRATSGGVDDSLGSEDDQADVDLDPNTAGEAFNSVFAGFQLWLFDSVKVGKGEASGWRMDSTVADEDPWVVCRVVLKPHDVPFARRHYYSTGRTGLTHTRSTDFPGDHGVDDHYYSPGAWNNWVIYNKLEPRKDRAGGGTDDNWTSNEEVAVAWHEYVVPLRPCTYPDTTLLKVNYYTEIDENYTGFSTTSVTVRFKGRVYLTTSLTDLSEATVLVEDWVSGAMFARGTRQYITEEIELPAFSTDVEAYIVLVWGMVFEDIPLPAVHYPNPTEWVTVKNLTGAGDLGGNMRVARNDGPESGNKDGYAPWVEFSDFLVPVARPDPPANQTRATSIVIDPGDVPGYCSGLIDTRGATSPMHALWWEFTPDADGEFIFHVFGSTAQTVVKVWNDAADAVIESVQEDEDLVGGIGCVSWWRGNLTGGVTYRIQTRRGRDQNTSAWSGQVQLWVETVRLPQADDIFVPEGNGNTIMVWREGHLINVSAFNASGWVAGGVAIDYTGRPMLDYRNVGDPGSHDLEHTGERLAILMHDTAIPPGNPYVIILDLFTLNPNEQPIDYIFWDGQVGVTPFGAGSLEVDAAGFMYAGSEGWFSKVAGGTISYEKSQPQNPQDAAILKFDLAAAWYQSGFEAEPPGYPILLLADYERTGTNFVRLSIDLSRLLYTSSGFYVTPEDGEGTLVKSITIDGAQLPDEVSPITPGAGPNAGPKGICPLYTGGFLLCNGQVVQRYDDDGALVQTYTPSGPTPQSLSDIDLTADRLHFYCYDMGVSRFYKMRISDGVQISTWSTFGYPGSSHSFVVYRPDRFVDVPEVPEECVVEVPSIGCLDDPPPSVSCADPTASSTGATWSPTHSPNVQRVGLRGS